MKDIITTKYGDFYICRGYERYYIDEFGRIYDSFIDDYCGLYEYPSGVLYAIIECNGYKHKITQFEMYARAFLDGNINKKLVCINRNKNDLNIANMVWGNPRDIFSILRLFFNQMCIDGYIVYNPTLGVKTPRNVNYEKTKEVLLTKEEANNLLEIFERTDLYLIVYMTLFYGFRRSEIIALKWSNFNFEKSTFEITDTIVMTKTIVSKNRTKTENSNMTYGILPELKKALIELKKEQEENKKLLGKEYQDNDLVFCKGDGTALRPDCLQRTFKRMLKKAGHPPMRFHDLRHSTASILYDCGWDLEKVKHWLRHSDIETTSNIYLKISKAREVLMANDLEGILKLKK